MSVRDGALMVACYNKTCDMSDIGHEICANLVSDLSETLEVDSACISACTADDELGLILNRDLLYFVIIDITVAVNTVRYAVVVHARDVCGRSV